MIGSNAPGRCRFQRPADRSPLPASPPAPIPTLEPARPGPPPRPRSHVRCGTPDGGVLPAISAAGLDTVAACRWREKKGADWFLSALRSGQKDGAKAAARDHKNPKAKDRAAHFELAGEVDDEGEQATWIVSAPFLGPYAHEQPYPPGTFLNDYQEFYKAYQAAFWHWLRTEAVDGKAQASRERFEQLLISLGRPLSEESPTHEPLEVAVDRLWGVPLSARDGSVDSLEWRFLRWVSGRK